ncbi:hypothetical protein [Cupriavidus basilensis]|uniref:hypothetical protein n=1 Tax=Cupriavidus basilensis TaxID=68895 RepID=UPI00157B7CE8|nr:hypothetical protein [Cupriavidus basilensis]
MPRKTVFVQSGAVYLRKAMIHPEKLMGIAGSYAREETVEMASAIDGYFTGDSQGWL